MPEEIKTKTKNQTKARTRPPRGWPGPFVSYPIPHYAAFFPSEDGLAGVTLAGVAAVSEGGACAWGRPLAGGASFSRRVARRDFSLLIEERFNKSVEPFPGRGELERAPLEQRHAEFFFELDQLAAHGRLLYPVGDMAHGLAEPARTGHVIEELEILGAAEAS